MKKRTKEILNDNVELIYKSYKPDDFKLLKTNREINQNHVAKIYGSMIKNKFIGSPILVDKDMNIIDGQHRYTAWQYIVMDANMGIISKDKLFPIKYTITDSNVKDLCVWINASNEAWKAKDYLSYYANTNDEYKKFKTFFEKYKGDITLNFAMYLLGGSDCADACRDFRDGLFVCKYEDRAEKFMETLLSFKHLVKDGQLSRDIYKHKLFQLALFKVSNIDGYFNGRMITKLSTSRLYKKAKVSFYVEDLLNIYNNRLKEQNRLTIK